MPAAFKLVRIPALKTVSDFRAHLATLGLELPCDDAITAGGASPLAQPIPDPAINGQRLTNRWAIQPMEGWDATTTGAPTDEVRRRWQRFGQTGASLIYGGEAMAVRPDGRANPHQLILDDLNLPAIAELRELLVGAARERFGASHTPIIGFQLTHSGRFCKPYDKRRLEPRVAFRHPILDAKFGVQSDAQVFTDDEVSLLIDDYIAAARRARSAGADFVDLKHCHGYLLHEFLGAHTRSGRYGGSFENRTRILRDIVSGIRAEGNPIEIGVRLSAFDFVPFRPDPTRAEPGKLGPGIPEEFAHCLPYRYAFGCDANNPVEPDLAETFQFADLCAELGVKLLNLTAGSPYYNPHIQRPAAYPPSDGYQPAHDPLIDVVRQIQVTRRVRQHLHQRRAAAAPRGEAPSTLNPLLSTPPVLIGTAYSYLQEYLPQVAQAVVREGWTDMVGLGRMTLSYPELLADAVGQGSLTAKLICRTFSDCTTAPRNGLPSGCYPLDKHYAARPEALALKEIKKRIGG